MIVRFRKPVRDAKRRARAVSNQVGNYAYNYVLVGDRKYRVYVEPGRPVAKITRVEE